MERRILEVSWDSLWRIFFMLLLVLILFLAQEALVVFFLAIVISSSIDPIVNYLQRRGVPRILGTLAIFIIALVILSLVLYAIIPVAMIEANSFLNNLTTSGTSILGSLGHSPLIQQLDKQMVAYRDLLVSGNISLFDTISSLFGGVILLIAVFVSSFYLTVNKGGVEKFLRAVLPDKQEESIVSIYLRAKKKLGLWLRGQIVLSIAVGLITYIGLQILGVKYSLVLAILTALFEIVPIAGPIFSGAVSFLVALQTSFALGIYVVLLFIFIQQLESHVATPVVLSRAVGLHPVAIIIALLAGSEIAGLVGLILAVPAAVVIGEIIEGWSERKRLARAS